MKKGVEKPVGNEIQNILRKVGLKATPKKILLLETLKHAHVPMSVQQLSQKLGSKLNMVTIYRAVEDLVQARVLNRVDFQEPQSYYEFIELDHHHHHIVCKNCRMIEDIGDCLDDNLEHKVLKKSSKFASVNNHSLEFFGLCKKCAA